MTDRRWLKGFSGQTANELIALEGRYRTDSIVLAFEQAMDQKSARASEQGLSEEEALTEAERTILIVESVEREVNNGGYDQFFENCGDEYADVMEDALRRIGCPKTAEIARDAVAIAEEFGDETENDERTARLNEIDERYFESGEDIASSLFEYIKANRLEITT
jgi:hypothetical protein